MGERAPYSRVYWSVVDDPKFVTVFDDDHHLATWLRLLIAADAIWPASPSIPVNARKASVKALATAGIVDLQGATRYRIHGLDAERGRRKAAATTRTPDGPPSGPPAGTPTVPERSPDGPSRARVAMLVSSGLGDARLGEGGPGETKPDADEPENDPWRADEAQAVDWLRRHKCTIREGDGYHQRLVTAVERHGVNAIVGQFDRLAKAGTKDGDIKGLLFGAIDLLDARGRPNVRELEAEERHDESEASFRSRVAETRRQNRLRFPNLYPADEPA